MPECLGEGPLTIHRDIHSARRHGCGPLQLSRPGPLQHRPRRTKTLGVSCVSFGAAGKAAVQFGLDERDDVDAVDQQGVPAIEEPRRIDLRPGHVHTAQHGAGQVGADEPGSAQVHVGEFCAPEVIGLTESCHGSTLPRLAQQRSSRRRCQVRLPNTACKLSNDSVHPLRCKVDDGFPVAWGSIGRADGSGAAGTAALRSGRWPGASHPFSEGPKRSIMAT
ncbi:hypothetical protein BJQ89_01161 [Arthrobacter sp. ES1]|nr:hypothetical protein [Arthrobacter sp. ES1]